MSDIVERLRHYASQMKPSGLGGPGHGLSPDRAPMLDEAADEIERLQKGIQDFLNGDYEPKVRKYDKCPHGQYGYEICEACIDAWFSKFLTTTLPPGSATG